MSHAPAPDAAPEQRLTVLLYSDDPAIRERMRMAIGRRPAKDLPEVEFVEVATGPIVVREVESGLVDLCVLDGEAWPTGGLGLSRQLKDEINEMPPCLVVLGRRDDAWLATWSGADATVLHPIDGPELAAATADLLRRSAVVSPTTV
jgi:DNA-binding response OmpR family regulator